jgi:hypothetical protein
MIGPQVTFHRSRFRRYDIIVLVAYRLRPPVTARGSSNPTKMNGAPRAIQIR